MIRECFFIVDPAPAPWSGVDGFSLLCNNFIYAKEAMMSSADEIFVDQFYTHDNRAMVRGCIFRTLLSRRTFVPEHELNDLVQETFCLAWGDFSNFRGEAEIDTWLFRIAKNVALGQGRYEKSRAIFVDLDATAAASDSVWTDPYEYMKLREKEVMLSKFLHRISARHARIFEMRCQGFSFNEIARAMDSTTATMKNSILRTTQHLRQGVREAGFVS